jgi:hypothetical protein
VPLNILDHPAVVRLFAGENIQVQELRQALVDFWQENGTFDICRNDCYSNRPDRAEGLRRGCCGSCDDFVVEQGCQRRNLACLLYTCIGLEDRLETLKLKKDFRTFCGLTSSLVLIYEPFFNHRRLPDRTRLYIAENRYGDIIITTNIIQDGER